MARLFGTDGIRGVANLDLTAELATNLGTAAVQVLAVGLAKKPVAVIGRDTRASGEFLEAALAAGMAAAGATVFRIGVAPTPEVAYLIDALDADLGAVISASHNPMPDNGIKFFAAGGRKLPDSLEDAIEDRLKNFKQLPVGSEVGRIIDNPMASGNYVDHLVDSLDIDLSGIKVVVDCANGAAHHTAPAAYRKAGADVIAIHAEPDGLNINANCGSTHLSDLITAVKENKADLGIAHDGDADRCLAVAADGSVVDGDQILAILAQAMKENLKLVNNHVVTTVMANLGLKKFLQTADIEVIETPVGDRYVLSAMEVGGYNLGGEQSGHIILADYATTGDGTLTALHLMQRMKQTGLPLAKLAMVVQKLPQVLLNVSGVDRNLGVSHPRVLAEVDRLREELGDTGRILLRPSGTEPLVRVMVEAPTNEQATAVAQALVAVVREVAAQ
ncbi:MAG: phosphoglucosamine mutase [Actinobacteria bacterium]|nr:phosphoglucosamine mutase [Actinomycetota bacterium]